MAAVAVGTVVDLLDDVAGVGGVTGGGGEVVRRAVVAVIGAEHAV